MSPCNVFVTESLTAHIKALWSIPSMYMLMYLQTFHLLLSFIKSIIGIQTLPSTYKLMYLQATFFTECFITHITAIWTLPSMYTLMKLQLHFFTECFITHHSNMDVPQYEHVDEASG